MQRCRLHILGASGSGTTTLGRAVADAWSVPHADSDDYFWHPTDPPYTSPRPEAERRELLHRMIVPREAWVLSGDMRSWGGDVLDHIDAIVLLTLDPAERMRRLEDRERRRHQARRRRSGTVGEDVGGWDARASAAGPVDPEPSDADPSGPEPLDSDLHDSDPLDAAGWIAFRDWALRYEDPDFTGRSRTSQETWLATREEPVLRLDSARSREDLLREVLAWDAAAPPPDESQPVEARRRPEGSRPAAAPPGPGGSPPGA